MPPKRAARRPDDDHDDDDDDDDDVDDSDDDDEELVSQETLDDQTVLNSEGGDLMTFSGEIESHLSPARKQERIVERSRLLGQVLLAESVRRLCRRAGVQMYATKSTDDTDTVLKVLKQIADKFIFNLCKELVRLCSHLKKKIITEEILKESLRTLDVKLFGSCTERHKPCATLKSRRNETGAETMRGSAKEIHHERNNDAPCVYFAASPFVQIFKLYLEEQATFEHPLKPTPGVISCIQFLMEQTLLDILEKARYAMREFSKKKANASPPGRATLYARDIKVVLVVLAHRHPILRGKMRPVLEEEAPQSPRGGGGGSGASRPKAKAKSKAKAKAKGAPARAKPAARAKKSGG